MTVEEKAIKEICIKCSSYDFCVKRNQLHCAETVAFLDGYEQGYEDCRYYAHDYYKPKWHKVADDDDYPPCEKDNYTINVLTDRSDIAYYNHDLDCWVAEFSSAEIDPPIAWCEIPKYTDKE